MALAAPAAPPCAVKGVFAGCKDDLREQLLSMIRSGEAKVLSWTKLPLRSCAFRVLYDELKHGEQRERDLAMLAKLSFRRALASRVEKPYMYAELSVRFMTEFASCSDHACFLIEYGVLDFLKHLCVEWDTDKVLACTWELLLTLCTAACPAHLCRLMCSDVFDHVLVGIRKVNCVTKECVLVSTAPDQSETAWCVPQSDEAVAERRAKCDDFRHKAAAMILYRCEHKKEEQDCVHATGAAWYDGRARDVKEAVLGSMGKCTCSTCVFEALSKRVGTERADRFARELLEEEERERAARAAAETSHAARRKAQKKKAERRRPDASKAASPSNHESKARRLPEETPPPKAEEAPTLQVELASESFREEQARILEDIVRSTSKSCDTCFDNVPARDMVTCPACGATVTCAWCMRSMRDIGARCTRCLSDLVY